MAINLIKNMNEYALYDKYVQKFGKIQKPMPGGIIEENVAMMQVALDTGKAIDLDDPDIEARWFGYADLPPGAVL